MRQGNPVIFYCFYCPGMDITVAVQEQLQRLSKQEQISQSHSGFNVYEKHSGSDNACAPHFHAYERAHE